SRAERQGVPGGGAQRTARAGDDAAREEAVRAEIERLEEARLAMERAEAERVAAARREMEEVEAKRRELERLETLQVEMDHRQQEMAEAEPEQEPVAAGAPIVSPDDEPDAPEVVDLDALHETEEKEPALAGAAAAKGHPGLLGAVKSAFTRGSRNHVHDFVPAPGGMGISRSICQKCGYVSISSDCRRTPDGVHLKKRKARTAPNRPQAIITPSRQTIDPSISHGTNWSTADSTNGASGSARPTSCSQAGASVRGKKIPDTKVSGRITALA